MFEFQRKSRRAETKTRRCHRCLGTGRAPCVICGGSGKVLKERDRLGAPVFSRCDGCLGNKSSRCRFCGGEGFT